MGGDLYPGRRTVYRSNEDSIAIGVPRGLRGESMENGESFENFPDPGIVSLDSVQIGSYFAQDIHDFKFRWFSLTAASRPSDVHSLERSHSAVLPFKTAESQPSLGFAIDSSPVHH